MPANCECIILIEKRLELKAVSVAIVILKLKLIRPHKAAPLWFTVSGHLVE